MVDEGTDGNVTPCWVKQSRYDCNCARGFALPAVVDVPTSVPLAGEAPDGELDVVPVVPAELVELLPQPAIASANASTAAIGTIIQRVLMSAIARLVSKTHV